MLISAVRCFLSEKFSQDLGFFSRSHFNDKSTSDKSRLINVPTPPPPLTCQDSWNGHMVALLTKPQLLQN